MGLFACKHDPDPSAIDAELYLLALNTDGNVWYKHSDQLLPKSSGSGHSQPLLRTRYNEVAATVLDGDGKVQPDAVFPIGSLVVKELCEDDGSINTYAVLLKRPAEPAADPNGWVWGYLRANGDVRASALDQGAGCRTCHGQTGHIDQTLMNLFFP